MSNFYAVPKRLTINLMRRNLRNVGILLAAFGVITTVAITEPASAAINYDAEIKKLQIQNSANAANRAALENTALTLEQKIAQLRETIASLDQQIRTNEASRADVTVQIAETEKKMTESQAVLGEVIRQLYMDNEMTMIEKMASSKNLSDFVDQEEYSMLMQEYIQQSLQEINALKKEQEQQKQLVEQLISDNKAMQAQVSSENQEVNRLLALNQQEQSEYTQTITTTSTQITDLQREQAEENLRFQREQEALAEAARRKAAEAAAAAARSGNAAPQQSAPAPAPAGVATVNGRDYPWANVPFPNEVADRWGMYLRQCVSYTAWKVAASGRNMPNWGGRGNAKQWDDNARAAGIPVDRNPRVGDIGVRNTGTYGHVVYVDAVNGDGSINISQYNAAWTGAYSEARIFPGDLVFIHFP